MKSPLLTVAKSPDPSAFFEGLQHTLREKTAKNHFWLIIAFQLLLQSDLINCHET